MGSILPLLILASLIGGSQAPTDTATYADEATRALVAVARARHRSQDTLVQDYQADLRFRTSFSLGRRTWGEAQPLQIEEQEARLAWQRPNLLQLDMVGRRDWVWDSEFGDRPRPRWNSPFFVPRALGDSVRLFGRYRDLTPRAAAPHPLSADGEEHYRFAVGDSMVIRLPELRVVVRAVTVVPKRSGPAYVAGELWIDQATGDVIRFSFRFVGTALWDQVAGKDSAEQARDNRLTNEFLQVTVDLEYALIQQRYWMPARQVVAGRVVGTPVGLDVALPFETVSTFRNYRVNTGLVLEFPAWDSLRALSARVEAVRAELRRGSRTNGFDMIRTMPGGGRWLTHWPPEDSLRAYDEWGDTLSRRTGDDARQEIRAMTGRLARLVDSLPGEMIGRPLAGFGIVRAAELFRYNRVQGTTLTLSGRTPTPFSFTELDALVRYGVADHRVMGRAQLRRDAPSGRFTATAQRDLVSTDPWFDGLTLGSSLRAALAGRDDGSYLLALGGRMQWEGGLTRGAELTLSGWLEDQRSAATQARATLPRLFGRSGRFGPSTPVREGLAAGIGLRVDQGWLVPEWRVDVQTQMMGRNVATRAAVEWHAPTPSGWDLRLVAGGAVGSRQMPQLGVQVGGVGSVRGYDVGSQRGEVAWASQLTRSLSERRFSSWYLFADAGQAAAVDRLGQTPVLVGAGGGLALLRGLIRMEIGVPLTQTAGPNRGLRFDLQFGGIP